MPNASCTTRGLGQTPPHTHTLLSSLVAFIDIGLNATLLGFCLFAVFAWWQAMKQMIKQFRASGEFEKAR